MRLGAHLQAGVLCFELRSPPGSATKLLTLCCPRRLLAPRGATRSLPAKPQGAACLWVLAPGVGRVLRVAPRG